MLEREQHDGVENLRVHFYGTQGSAPTFPVRHEIEAYHAQWGSDLLERVWRDLERHRDAEGRLAESLERVFGGGLDRQTAAAYLRGLGLPAPLVYGGWTTCVRVETADGEDIVLDAGSGFRNCAKALQEKWGERPARVVHLFGSHSHCDHTEGFDLAAVCFDRRNTIRVYGNRGFLRALDSNLGIFSRAVRPSLRGLHTPLTFETMGARFEAVELRDADDDGGGGIPGAEARDASEPVRIGATSVTPIAVHHTAPCLAFRIERAGRKFVFCTDHELRRGADPADPRQRASEAAERRLEEHAGGADLLYRDAQYLRAEYDGRHGIGTLPAEPRIDWGHSTVEDVVEMAERCGVRRALLGHHDPDREWTERRAMDERVRRLSRSGIAELAASGTVVDL